MALVAVPVGEGSGEETADGGRLPGRQPHPGSREIHVTLSEKARPVRTQRLHVEGRTRSRPFNVTPAQADAIRALADEVGKPNLSELVDRAVVLTYDRGVATADD